MLTTKIIVGHTPYRITHASDYFSQLYKYAMELISRGHAYVCHQEPDVVRRWDAPPSPWRERPVEESLALFEVCRSTSAKTGNNYYCWEIP